MGSVETFSLSIAPFSQSPRTIWIYLPDGYKQTKRSYPVLYMFDGHNLFSDKTATYGRSWRMNRYLNRHSIPLIVVGIDCNHSGDGRLEEYCPVRLPPRSRFDGLYETDHLHPCGEKTAQWVVEVLMPYCQTHYRIKKGRRNTAIGGSSMGGLMALYMSVRYGRLFEKAVCLSPTLDITAPQLLRKIRRQAITDDSRIFISYGEKECSAGNLKNLLAVHNALSEKKIMTFLYLQPDGGHDEASWGKQIPLFLQALWPQFKTAERRTSRSA